MSQEEDIECVSEPYDISHAPFIIHNSIHEIRRTCDKRVMRHKEKIPGIEFVYAPAFASQLIDSEQTLTDSKLDDCESSFTEEKSLKIKSSSPSESSLEEDKNSVYRCKSKDGRKIKCCCKSVQVKASSRIDNKSSASLKCH